MRTNKPVFSATAKLMSVVAASLLIVGCNTVKGAGEDIESVGEAGEDAID